MKIWRGYEVDEVDFLIVGGEDDVTSVHPK